MAYNRYGMFTIDGEVKNVPFVKLPKKTSDKEHIYKIGVTRLDLVSDKYYKNPNYGWLIELANPDLGSLEFKIKDGSALLIPYPLEASLKDYQDEILNYKKYYGI